MCCGRKRSYLKIITEVHLEVGPIAQLIFEAITELQVDLLKEFVHIGQAKYFLIGHLQLCTNTHTCKMGTS